jgi:hypothetical protein
MSNNIFEHQYFWGNLDKKIVMTDYEAIGIAEGFIEETDNTRVIAAWQHLVDTGLAWSLQGWFGRTANQMIKEGILSSPKKLN